MKCDHAEWAPACPFCCEPAVAVCVGNHVDDGSHPDDKPRRLLLVIFDVTDLTADQSDMLGFEASVQAEANEHHPDVKIVAVVEREV